MASDTDRQSQNSSSSVVQKHRACDECRSRKLACSKEQDGCSRCGKEGLRCHYSAQKPMGRPRKRRNVDDGEQVERQRTSPIRQARREKSSQKKHQNSFPSTETRSENLLPQDSLPPSSHVSEFAPYDASTMVPMDQSLSFLNDQRQGNDLDFLDIIPQDFSPNVQSSHETPPQMHSAENTLTQVSSPFGLDLSGGVDLLGGIGFEHQQPGAHIPRSSATRVMHDSFHHYIAKSWDQQPQATESLSSNTPPSTVSDIPSSTSLRPHPNISCGCLSSLYLTLDCLTNLPADIPSAIRTVRNASRIAHNTINCEICSGKNFVNHVSQPVPVQAFQNLMLLAALVPSACNAYAVILERVDMEADHARRANEELWFSFKEIGGHWGMEAEDDKHCLLMQNFNDKKMPPDMWRAAIREVIRADVDGVEVGSSVGGCGGKGLRDVIKALEERSHRRHASMDAAAAMGELPKHSLITPASHRPVPPEERHCMRVLDAARMALNNLVIA